MNPVALFHSLLARLLAFNLPLLFVFATCLASPASAQAQNAELKIGGTGTGLGTLQKLADAFKKIHPEAKIKIMPNLGSTGGIKAVSAGALHIGVSSRPLSQSERSARLSEREISRSPFVFVTSLKTPVSNLTFAEVAAIYSGEKKFWSNGTKVRPVLRPVKDTDTELIKAMSPEIARACASAHAREGMNIELTDTDAAEILERVPGSIGTSTLALIISEKRKLKPLALNGIAPSLRALADNSYPYHKAMYLITGPDPAPLTQQFVRFVTSPAGARILRKNGNLVSPGQQ